MPNVNYSKSSSRNICQHQVTDGNCVGCSRSRLASQPTQRNVEYTNPLSYNGAPALSVPSGFSQGGLPLSLQLVEKHLQEALLCQVGYRYEQATPWHKKRRPMKSA